MWLELPGSHEGKPDKSCRKATGVKQCKQLHLGLRNNCACLHGECNRRRPGSGGPTCHCTRINIHGCGGHDKGINKNCWRQRNSAKTNPTCARRCEDGPRPLNFKTANMLDRVLRVQGTLAQGRAWEHLPQWCPVEKKGQEKKVGVAAGWEDVEVISPKGKRA